MREDVVCVLTPPGVSAVGVVGLRGPNVWAKLSPFFQSHRLPNLQQQSRCWHGKLIKQGIGDDIVLTLAGDETLQQIEVQMHGGPGIVGWMVALAQELDCRLIDWHDWLQDAHSYWTLLPKAITKKTASILLDQCMGAFERAVTEIDRKIRSGSTNETREAIREEVKTLKKWSALGEHLVQPWKVVIAGPPNVGKSSLFNALLGFERAITSPVLGTTRDLISSIVVWKGYPLELIDTAGIRETDHAVERAGIDKASQALSEADVVLWLIDLSQPSAEPPDGIQPTLLVGTKDDIRQSMEVPTHFAVSATQGSGLEALFEGILRLLVPEEPPPGQAMAISPADVRALVELEERLR